MSDSRDFPDDWIAEDEEMLALPDRVNALTRETREPEIPDPVKIRQDIETELFLRRGVDRTEAAINIAVRERVGLESQIGISNDLRERIARSETREKVLEDALRYLIEQGRHSRSLSGSGDCGDHCGNGCPWCEAFRALERKG